MAALGIANYLRVIVQFVLPRRFVHFPGPYVNGVRWESESLDSPRKQFRESLEIAFLIRVATAC